MDKKSPRNSSRWFDSRFWGFQMLAEWTGLEPATPGVTGRYSNQLNYHSMRLRTLLRALQVPLTCLAAIRARAGLSWRPLGDSNPCNHRERVVS